MCMLKRRSRNSKLHIQYELKKEKELAEDQEAIKEEEGKSSEKEGKEKKERVNREEKITAPEREEEKKIPETKPVEPEFFIHLPEKITTGDIFTAGLALTGSEKVRVIKIEIEFDPASIQVLEIEKGELLRAKDIKSHFFKTLDNTSGKIRLSFAFENNPAGKKMELAVLNCRAKAAGKGELKPVLFEVLDAKMKKIESRFPVVPIEVVK